MGKRCFKHVAMLLGVHRHNLRLKANKLRLLMEQPTDPATPEEFSKFAEERCLFAEIADLKREDAIWEEQARRRRDNAIYYVLDQARVQADLSMEDSLLFVDPKYSCSPGY